MILLRLARDSRAGFLYIVQDVLYVCKMRFCYIKKCENLQKIEKNVL